MLNGAIFLRQLTRSQLKSLNQVVKNSSLKHCQQNFFTKCGNFIFSANKLFEHSISFL